VPPILNTKLKINQNGLKITLAKFTPILGNRGAIEMSNVTRDRFRACGVKYANWWCNKKYRSLTA
jgi:hypothetical protein